MRHRGRNLILNAVRFEQSAEFGNILQKIREKELQQEELRQLERRHEPADGRRNDRPQVLADAGQSRIRNLGPRSARPNPLLQLGRVAQPAGPARRPRRRRRHLPAAEEVSHDAEAHVRQLHRRFRVVHAGRRRRLRARRSLGGAAPFGGQQEVVVHRADRSRQQRGIRAAVARERREFLHGRARGDLQQRYVEKGRAVRGRVPRAPVYEPRGCGVGEVRSAVRWRFLYVVLSDAGDFLSQPKRLVGLHGRFKAERNPSGDNVASDKTYRTHVPTS